MPPVPGPDRGPPDEGSSSEDAAGGTGDPASPISEGHLCPKGAASFELLTHAARQTAVPIGTVKFSNRLPTEEKTLQDTFIDENQALDGYAFVVNSILSGQGRALKDRFRRIIDEA